MAAVKSHGNRSTEKRLRSILRNAHIRGWSGQEKRLPGVPDFVFPRSRLAVFVDGCFWHGCPRCYREPRTSVSYWQRKRQRNIARDRRVSAKLRRLGWSVLRVREHSLRQPKKVVDSIRHKLTIHRVRRHNKRLKLTEGALAKSNCPRTEKSKLHHTHLIEAFRNAHVFMVGWLPCALLTASWLVSCNSLVVAATQRHHRTFTLR